MATSMPSLLCLVVFSSIFQLASLLFVAAPFFFTSRAFVLPGDTLRGTVHGIMRRLVQGVEARCVEWMPWSAGYCFEPYLTHPPRVLVLSQADDAAGCCSCTFRPRIWPPSLCTQRPEWHRAGKVSLLRRPRVVRVWRGTHAHLWP